MDVEELVKLYFEAGYSYNIILRFLDGLHGIYLSLRTLKRLLNQMGLKRRGVSTNLVLASDCIKVLICQQYYFICHVAHLKNAE